MAWVWGVGWTVAGVVCNVGRVSIEAEYGMCTVVGVGSEVGLWSELVLV